MASGMYAAGMAAIMGGNVDLTNSAISVVLVGPGYVPDLEADQTQADISEDDQVAEGTLAGKTIDGTTFRADPLTFPSVGGSVAVAGVVIIADDGTQSGSTLLAYLDNAPGLPISPDGTDITLNWDTGTAGIFKF